MGGGGHEAQGFNFTLPHDVAESANAQGAWRYCQDCHAMFYDGFAAKGLCPGHKGHGPRGLVLLGHEAAGFNFVLPHDTQSPASDPARLTLTGPVWVVSLNHEQAESVEGSLQFIAGAASLGDEEEIGAALGAAAGLIQLMDSLGGDQGVDVQGVLGVGGVIVTSHLSGMYETLTKGAGVAVAGANIMDFVLNAGGKVPEVASTLGIGVAAQVFSRVAGGMPFGWALAEAFGVIVDLLKPAPDPNEHGGIHADRTPVGDWERFIMAQIPPGNQIALLSWQGLFSAQNGGGADVYANRVKVGPWETWNIVDNHDGTLSFQTADGHLLTATNGGGPGSYCLANQTAVTASERFVKEDVAGGHIALKTQKGTYLSVQSGK